MCIGEFETCSVCRKKKNCCSSFNKIDRPILSETEMKNISVLHGSDNFVKTHNGTYQIKTTGGVCNYFVDGKCSIYNIRPYDCRLFPYDIKKIDGEYFLVLYKLDCLKNFVSTNVDEIVEGLRPILEEYVDDRLNKKLKNFEFEIIKKI